MAPIRHGLAGLLCTLAVCSGARAQAPNPSFSHGLPADSTWFPIAVWLQEPADAARYRQAGINLYVGLWDGPTEQQLTAMRSAGMPVICAQNATGLAWRDSATIVGWMHGDEPDNAQWNEGTQTYDPCISPDTVLAHYQLWRQNDTTRPVYLNLGRGVAYTQWGGRGTCTGNTSMYPRYLQGCDVVSFDIYPVTSSEPQVQGQLYYVPKGIDSLRMWGGDTVPAWCWIECTHINSQDKPTPAQVRAEVWMAVIHGARGFGYFCHEWVPSFNHHALLDDAEMLAAVTQINAEVRSLAPVLNSGVRHDRIAVTSSNSAVPIDFVEISHPGPGYMQYTFSYLLAVSMRDDTTTGTFSFPAAPLPCAVTDLEDSSNVPLVGGWTVAFEPWEVHLYEIGYCDAAHPEAQAGQAPGQPNTAARRYDLSGKTCTVRNPASATVVTPGRRDADSRVRLPSLSD